jgi:hypothetical protein
MGRALLQGLSQQDLGRVLLLDRCPMQVYDATAGKLRSASAGEIPWPLQWLADGRHKKHIWCPPRAPDIGTFHKQMQNNVCRMSWKFFHALQKSPDMPVIARYPGAPTRACILHDNRPLMFWGSTLSRVAMSAAAAARQWSLHRGEHYTNMSQLTITAFKMLRTSSWCFVPRDKGCGYVAHKREQVGMVHDRVLGGVEYREISPSGINLPILKSHYVSISSRCWQVLLL